MNQVPILLPVRADAVRVFCGYKLSTMNREDFYRELGETFMPGTPYMQASLGLSGYIPAVLDPPEGSGLPDEVALIVYASLKVYEEERNSLRRRMYTHSHSAVFDMQAPGAGSQSPGPASQPNQRRDRFSWYLFEHETDWQAGVTRLLYFTASPVREGLPKDFIDRSVKAKDRLQEVGVDQLIAVATNQYVSIWLHSQQAIEIPADLFGFNSEGIELARDLTALPVPMPRLEEGVKITEPSMFSFRFVRELRFFL
jgi:hypothetical protein